MAHILGIETSCDETAAAVYDTEKHQIISNNLFSQINLHRVYGGVVPEIASRSHLEKIAPIVRATLDEANISIDAIDAIAVTNKPGLAGSLLIGFCFAKALALSLKKPLIPVNHLEGHIASAWLDATGTHRIDIPFPHVCFSASGGHTALYHVTKPGTYTDIGQTLDDAAGEAFDKIAKLIGLGYPGGPIIEQMAQEMHFEDFFSYPRTKQKKDAYDFSFSGLKTAVLYDLAKRGYVDLNTCARTDTLTQEVQKQVASSLLVCIGDIFVTVLSRVFKGVPSLRGLTFVGGVACNKYLRKRLADLCEQNNIFFAASPPRFSTDNGAMIALVGSYKYTQQNWSPLTADIFE